MLILRQNTAIKVHYQFVALSFSNCGIYVIVNKDSNCSQVYVRCEIKYRRFHLQIFFFACIYLVSAGYPESNDHGSTTYEEKTKPVHIPIYKKYGKFFQLSYYSPKGKGGWGDCVEIYLINNSILDDLQSFPKESNFLKLLNKELDK